jgi:hypothetical protein
MARFGSYSSGGSEGSRFGSYSGGRDLRFNDSEDDDLKKVIKEVANSEARIKAAGKGDSIKESQTPGFLAKAMDVLMRSSYGANNALREIIDPSRGVTPGKFDPIQALVRGYKNEEKTTGRDIFKDLGVSTEPLFSVKPFKMFGSDIKFSPSKAGIAGFATDILNPLDALNWLTFKVGPIAKTVGKSGIDLFPKAFGDLRSAEIVAELGEKAKGVSGKNVAELYGNILRAGGKDGVDNLSRFMRKGMDETNTNLKTKLPGIDKRSSIKAGIHVPIINKAVGEVSIPGTDSVVKTMTAVGDRFARTGPGEALGKMFGGKKFTPRTVSSNVARRLITGNVEYGTKEWDDAFKQVTDLVEGKAEYTTHREDLHKTFETARQLEDDFSKRVQTIFRGSTIPERKLILDTVARGADTELLPEKLRPMAQQFKSWTHSIVKEYQDMGIPIRELENYVPYITNGRLSKAESMAVKQEFGRENVTRTKFDGSRETLATGFDPYIMDRTLGSTPKEINRFLGREWLTEDAAVAMGLRGTKFIRAKEMIKFMDGVVAKYAVNPEDVRKLMLENYGVYSIKRSAENGVKFVPAELEAGASRYKDDLPVIALPAEFASVFNDYADLYLSPTASNSVAALFDKATQAFRTVAYMWNPGHIPRDFFSNISNSWLAGLRDPSVYIRSAKLLKPLSKGGVEGNEGASMFVKSTGKTKTGKELYENAKTLGIVDTGQALGETPRSIEAKLGGRSWKDPKKYSDAYTGTMIDWTRRTDNFTRFSLFIDGLEKGMTFEASAVRAKKFLFDYFDLTPFERKYMRRVMPFYTWMRKNIPLQFEELLKNPGKLETFGKYHQNLAGGDTDNSDMPDYVKEGLGIKLPGGQVMMPNLPYADMARIPTNINQLREFVSNVNPVIRALPEVTMNEEFFSGLPLEQYRGERRGVPGLDAILRRLGGPDLPDIVPKRTAGYVANQLPFLRNIDTMVDPENPKSVARLMSFLGMPSSYPVEHARKSAIYEDRDRLRDLIRFLKDEGEKVPTTRELGK